MGPQTGSKEPQIAQNRHSVPEAGLVSPNWRNSMKQGWNKSGHIQGDAAELFLGSGGPLGGP